MRCNQNVLIYQYQLFIVFPRTAKTHSWCRWMWLDSSWYVLHIKPQLTIVLIVTPVFVLWRRRGPAWGGAPLWTNYSQSYCYIKLPSTLQTNAYNALLQWTHIRGEGGDIFLWLWLELLWRKYSFLSRMHFADNWLFIKHKYIKENVPTLDQAEIDWSK